jgi:hypothetical protein
VADEAREHDDLVRDEDDHDLLTFSEGGIRLREEIALTEAALRDNPTEALRARLAALTEALERNTRQAGANPGDTGFLNYTPPDRTRPGSGDQPR